MTATIVDFAARRAERGAASRADSEVESYGIAEWPGAAGFELYAEMRSGRRVVLAENLSSGEATARLLTARTPKAEKARGAPRSSG